MAEEKKSPRQAVDSLTQEIRAALLESGITLGQTDELQRFLESALDIKARLAEGQQYRDRGDEELAESRERRAEEELDELRDRLKEHQDQPQTEPSESQSQDGRTTRQTTRDGRNRPTTRRGRPGKAGAGQADKARKTADAASKARKAQQAAATAKKAQQAGAATARLARLAPLLANPYFWIVVLILLVILIIIGLFMAFGGTAHKTSDLGGGSFPVAMNASNPSHVALVDEVNALKATGGLSFAAGLEQDIVWQGSTTNLDWRVMVTLKYLGEKWYARNKGTVGIVLSASNGPDATRRQAEVTIGSNTKSETVDAISAYRTGQAIGIDRIGRVSNALAAACFDDFDGDPTNNAVVEVAWQEIASQDTIRPVFEQLQVDASAVFPNVAKLALLGQQAANNSSVRQRLEETKDDEKSLIKVTTVALEYLITNLGNIGSAVGQGVDSRTIQYASSARAKLQEALDATSGDVTAWGKDEVVEKLRDGLQMTFRSMQVVNMVGWKTKENCRLWKAAEARERVRQLVSDVVSMPADPSLVPANKDWNPDLMVRQLIVYSPEDDLDNGLSDLDVFPQGVAAVSEGGAGFDIEGVDGQIDEKDNHFMSLPLDAGVFSKIGTIFVYKDENRWAAASGVVARLGWDDSVPAEQVLGDFQRQFDGDASGGEGYTQTVTYKKFVQISF